jgi:chemotaxis protein CheC
MGSKDGDLDELGKSAITEIGNILISAYIGSLAGLTRTTIKPTIPHLCIDMANAILSVPAIEFGKVADKALIIESSFAADNMNTSGFFILVPDMPSFTRIMESLGVT